MSVSISVIDKSPLPANFLAESSLTNEPLEFQASFNDDEGDDVDDGPADDDDDIVLGLMSDSVMNTKGTLSGSDDDRDEDDDQDGDDLDFSAVDVTGHAFATETDLALAA